VSGTRATCSPGTGFQRRRLFELDGLPPEQLILLRDVGGRRLDLPLELVRSLFELLVEVGLFERLAAVVEDGDHGGQLAVVRQDLAAIASTGIASPALGSTSPISPTRR